MEKRRLGKTEYRSSIAIFGAAALGDVTQAVADKAMQDVINAGINHIDVAPSYGNAEERLGPWLVKERERFFLGCKTMKRKKEGAAAELLGSLKRLQVDSFDLYQAHAVKNMDELDKVTAPGGALEAMLEAREQGLTRFIGITGHGVESPAVFLEALRRFDFDTVLFPINFVQYADTEFRRNTEALLQVCREREIGSMIIKAICRAPWGELPQTHTTWYKPFEEPDEIQTAVDFSLSRDVSGLCTAGDVTLLPLFIEACERFQPMDDVRQEALIATASQYEPLFV